MSTSNNDPETAPGDDIHQGYDLESGILSRVREWSDVFPSIRLGRTLRVAASPPLILLTSIVLAVWLIGQSFLFGPTGDEAIRHPTDLHPSNLSYFFDPSLMPGFLVRYVLGMIPTTIFESGLSWQKLLEIVWALFVWAPLAMFLTRQGALLTAGRTMMDVRSGLSLTLRRTPAAWLAAVVPMACTISLGLLILTIGWLTRIDIPLIDMALSLLIVLIAVPCGLLVFGANFAVPLSWAALANEPDPDPLDSLSRGYEYLFRRPIRLVGYLLVCLVMIFLVALIAYFISRSAEAVAGTMLGWSGGSLVTRVSVAKLLQWFPVIVAFTLMWSLLGGVYLLLRCDAGGQEVEDIWQPTPPESPPLPTLNPSE